MNFEIFLFTTVKYNTLTQFIHTLILKHHTNHHFFYISTLYYI